MSIRSGLVLITNVGVFTIFYISNLFLRPKSTFSIVVVAFPDLMMDVNAARNAEIKW